MKEMFDESTTSTHNGKPLPEPFTFKFSWSAYETIEEVRAANDLLKDEEVIKVRNAQRLNKARANQNSKELDIRAKAFEAANGKDVTNPYVKSDLKNDEQYRLKEFVKVVMSGGRYTEAEARELASTTLGIAWAE